MSNKLTTTYCWSDIQNEIDRQIENYIGESTLVQFDIFEASDDGGFITSLHKVAIQGHAVFRAYEWDGVWEANSESFESAILINPTYLQLCDVLHQQIITTQNTTDVIFEGIQPEYYVDLENTQCTLWTPLRDIPVYSFILGSNEN